MAGTALAPAPVMFEAFVPLTWNGQRLAEVREKAGFATPKALADATGLSPSTITRWESGQRTPGAQELYDLAEFLSVAPDVFGQDVGTHIRIRRKPKPDADETE